MVFHRHVSFPVDAPLAPFQDVSVLVWSFVRSGPTEEQGPGDLSTVSVFPLLKKNTHQQHMVNMSGLYMFEVLVFG